MNILYIKIWKLWKSDFTLSPEFAIMTCCALQLSIPLVTFPNYSCKTVSFVMCGNWSLSPIISAISQWPNRDFLKCQNLATSLLIKHSLVVLRFCISIRTFKRFDSESFCQLNGCFHRGMDLWRSLLHHF